MADLKTEESTSVNVLKAAQKENEGGKSFDVSMVDISPDSCKGNRQCNNHELDHRRNNEYTAANNEDEIVLATNVVTEKSVPPSTLNAVHTVEEGTWQHPIADTRTSNINSLDGKDRAVAADEKIPDSFEPSFDIHLSHGASPIGEDWEESPRPDLQPDPDISHTEDHHGDTVLKKAKQWLSYCGSYIRNFIKIVLLLIVVYTIFSEIGNVLFLISEKLETTGVKIQYPQPHLSHLVTEFLIHHIQFDIVVLRLIFTVLLTIGKLTLYINLMISEITNSLVIQYDTGEFALFMRIMAISVLVIVGGITYFVHIIVVNMAYLIDELPFMELINQI